MAGDRKQVTAHLSYAVAVEQFSTLGRVIEYGPGTVVLEVPRERAGATVTTLELLDSVIDVSLSDPPLEETLRGLYELTP